MSLQKSVAVTIAHGAESTWGTAATAGGTSKYIRRVQSSLAPNADAFQSNEARTDQQIYDARLGTRRAAGTVEGELSLTTFDDWLAAALRSSWAAGTTKTEADFTSVAADNATSKFTVGGSTWAAQGVRVGDVLRFTNLSAAANNSKNFQVVALSGVDATVYPAPTTMSADTAFNVAVVGYKCLVGTDEHSFTIEQRNPDQDISQLFTGMRLNNTAIRIPPNGLATCSFDFMGRALELLTGSNSPYFTSITAAPATALMAGPNGFMWLNGVQRTVVTGLDLTIGHQLSDTPVVGSNYVPEIFYGSTVVNGNVSAYFEDETLLQAFLDETYVDIMCRLDAPAVGSSPSEFLNIVMTRVKLLGHQMSVGPNGGVISSFPFQALLKETATGYDASTIVLQRSL